MQYFCTILVNKTLSFDNTHSYEYMRKVFQIVIAFRDSVALNAHEAFAIETSPTWDTDTCLFFHTEYNTITAQKYNSIRNKSTLHLLVNRITYYPLILTQDIIRERNVLHFKMHTDGLSTCIQRDVHICNRNTLHLLMLLLCLLVAYSIYTQV